MKNHLLTNTSESWEKLIKEFESFGGIARNIIHREGAHGLGLFPIDPNQIVQLHAPEHLLVSTNNIELREDKIYISDKSVHPKGFAEWYEKFQNEYSWGAEAQANIQNFEKNLKNLSTDILNLLEELGLLNQKKRFSSANELQNTFKRFILSRQISWKNGVVMMPIIELVNHSPNHPGWIINKQGISVMGKYSEEVLVRYSKSDPLKRFIQYGFNCKEEFGFSLNVRVIHNGKTVVVNGGGLNVNPLKPTKIRIKNNVIALYQPLIGSINNPRYPRMLFQKMFKNIDGIDSDELFEQIYTANMNSIISIIRKINTHKNKFLLELEEACLNQLEAISSHYGNKDLTY